MGQKIAIASDVVPVSLNPRSAMAADLPSTRGMNMLIFPASVSGLSVTRAMFMVPAIIFAALARDTIWRAGQSTSLSPATTWLLRPAVAMAQTGTPSKTTSCLLKTYGTSAAVIIPTVFSGRPSASLTDMAWAIGSSWS